MTLPLTADELIAGINKLPQELCDQIEALVLSVDDEPYHRVLNKDYKQPVQLQLNREIRSNLAKKYYGDGAVWEFSSTRQNLNYPTPDGDPGLWSMWLNRPHETADSGSFVRWADTRSSEVKQILAVDCEDNMFFDPHDDFKNHDVRHDVVRRHWHIFPAALLSDEHKKGQHLFPYYCGCSRWSVETLAITLRRSVRRVLRSR